MMRNLLMHIAFAMAGAGLTFAQPSQKQAFTLRIAADMPFKAGSNIFIRVTETNTSDHIVDCQADDANFNSDVTFTYDLRDSHGRPVEMRSDVDDWPSAARTCKLAPGKSYSSERLISWLFHLVPGSYTIQVSRRADGESGSVVTSNEVSFKVTE